MRKRDARRILGEAWDLAAAGAPADGLELLRRHEAALAALVPARLFKTMAEILRSTRDWVAYDRFLFAAVQQDPVPDLFKVRTFLEADGDRMAPEEVVALARSRLGQTALEPVAKLRLAMALASNGEGGEASVLAAWALAGIADPVLRRDLGQSVAAKFGWYGLRAEANALMDRVFEGADPGALRAAKLRMRLRERIRRADLEEAAWAFRHGLDARGALLLPMLDHRWLLDGPSEALLAESMAWEADAKGDAGPFRARQVALAVRLGLEAKALAILGGAPATGNFFDRSLPVAWLLSRHPPLLAAAGLAPEAVQPYADLFSHLRENGAALDARFSSLQARVAVVGNGPNVMDAPDGPRIDACAEVVRFNQAKTEGAFAPHTGTRTTLHVVPSNASPLDFPALPSNPVLALTMVDAAHRGRKWETVMARRRQGHRVAEIPDETTPSLMSAIEATPSAGMRVLWWLRSLRGQVADLVVAGFSFQAQAPAGSSHYFAKSRASGHHDWAREIALQRQMFGVEDGA